MNDTGRSLSAREWFADYRGDRFKKRNNNGSYSDYYNNGAGAGGAGVNLLSPEWYSWRNAELDAYANYRLNNPASYQGYQGVVEGRQDPFAADPFAAKREEARAQQEAFRNRIPIAQDRRFPGTLPGGFPGGGGGGGGFLPRGLWPGVGSFPGSRPSREWSRFPFTSRTFTDPSSVVLHHGNSPSIGGIRGSNASNVPTGLNFSSIPANDINAFSSRPMYSNPQGIVDGRFGALDATGKL